MVGPHFRIEGRVGENGSAGVRIQTRRSRAGRGLASPTSAVDDVGGSKPISSRARAIDQTGTRVFGPDVGQEIRFDAYDQYAEDGTRDLVIALVRELRDRYSIKSDVSARWVPDFDQVDEDGGSVFIDVATSGFGTDALLDMEDQLGEWLGVAYPELDDRVVVYLRAGQ